MARIYLTHFERDYAAMNAVWPSAFEPGKLPARTTIGVTGAGRRGAGRDRPRRPPSLERDQEELRDFSGSIADK